MKSMTVSANAQTVKQDWYVVDASGKAGPFGDSLAFTVRPLAEVTAIANAPWAPHGELQVGSTMNVFGWAGDWDDPPSPEWLRALTLLRTPALVGLGLSWVPDFVRGLWVQGPGQTGAVPYNPDTSYLLQQRFAAALPAVPAYAEIRAAYLPGGAQYEAEQARLVEVERVAQANDAWVAEQAFAIWRSYDWGGLDTLESIIAGFPWAAFHPERQAAILAQVEAMLAALPQPTLVPEFSP